MTEITDNLTYRVQIHKTTIESDILQHTRDYIFSDCTVQEIDKISNAFYYCNPFIDSHSIEWAQLLS